MEQAVINQTWHQVSEVELIYKSKVKASQRPKVASSKDAVDLFRQTWDKNKIELVEQFKVAYLNQGNQVLAIYELSTGGLTYTAADPRLIFAAALKLCACNLLMCHNHPSGTLTPSRADEALTEKVKNAGELLDIKLLDHLIISAEGYYSFSDERLWQ